MAISLSPFHLLNAPNIPFPAPTSTSFTLTPPLTTMTDIWRKPGPPEINTFNAPVIYKKINLATFQRVRVTVSGWVKSGIEFVDDTPHVSTVACDRWADWSLVKEGINSASGGGANETQVTIEMEQREIDDTLWVYVVEGGQRSGIREVTWLLSLAKDKDRKPREREAWVGVYAATPTIREGRKPLDVRFGGFEVVLRDI
ncbi:hypothetical protein BKA64DRAFT_732341 [Cadophora sp. MPI-SDFR-AT-0126]|nr:hypothetical protein BKA64DRAFT_732341 [Leotiomycetes sp. MPI-SDFR-AT-0126]